MEVAKGLEMPRGRHASPLIKTAVPETRPHRSRRTGSMDGNHISFPTPGVSPEGVTLEKTAPGSSHIRKQAESLLVTGAAQADPQIFRANNYIFRANNY